MGKVRTRSNRALNNHICYVTSLRRILVEEQVEKERRETFAVRGFILLSLLLQCSFETRALVHSHTLSSHCLDCLVETQPSFSSGAFSFSVFAFWTEKKWGYCRWACRSWRLKLSSPIGGTRSTTPLSGRTLFSTFSVPLMLSSLP